jgi:hypothetical protein
MTTAAEDRPAGQGLLVPALVFIALVAAVGSPGAPLIISVATTRHVWLGCYQAACSVRSKQCLYRQGA